MVPIFYDADDPVGIKILIAAICIVFLYLSRDTFFNAVSNISRSVGSASCSWDLISTRSSSLSHWHCRTCGEDGCSPSGKNRLIV